ncbi:MAG: hybrid sensor histidine kinase/response regulator [Colwellia sp.]|nr:hybrid sensor histidine kinase/response regulator [Colwellia sp.]
MKKSKIDLRGSKILIVDDKKENVELLVQILTAEGYEIAFAMDGEKAIQVASIYLPDLILLDVMMPGIDGFETCRRLKSLHGLKEVPVIFVTGKDKVSDIVEAFNIGAVDYVTKPIRHEEIIARVATHIKLQYLILLRNELISQLRVQNIELEQLSKAKDLQLEKSEKLSHLGEMVGELTHEVSTPLGIMNTAMTNLVDQKNLFKEKLNSQKVTKNTLDNFLDLLERSFDIVLSSLGHSINLVDSFRKIIVGEFNQSKTNFDLAVYLEDIELILGPKIKNSPHSLVFNCASNIFIFAESGVLSQILLNIINNALRHAFLADDKGCITINIDKSDTNVIIKISDNGVGVSQEQQNIMFDKYYTTKPDEGGSGLGLYIVKKLVEDNLSGEINLVSVIGEGSCFTIILPDGIKM